MNAFKCPNCTKSTMGWENYCVDCGYPLNVECPECGESWRYMFIYEHCPNCGHDMSQVPIVFEQRPETVTITKTVKKEKSK
jgi:hypothetical protein